MSEQPTGLIRVLLDANAEFGDRHDAAMDLSAFDGDRVEEVLAQLACDERVDEGLADACGESLAEIWCRKGAVTSQIFIKLTPVSLRTALATLRACSPVLAAEAECIQNAG
jgi:hypothetical protein